MTAEYSAMHKLKDLRRREAEARRAVLEIEMEERALLKDWSSVRLKGEDLFFKVPNPSVKRLCEDAIELRENDDISGKMLEKLFENLGVEWFEIEEA